MTKFYKAYGRVSRVSERERISAAVRRAVNERDGRVCQLCGHRIKDGQRKHLHHWDHAEGGGPSTVKNLAVTHAICNQAVGTRKKAAAKKLARARYPVWVTDAAARKRDREQDREIQARYRRW